MDKHTYVTRLKKMLNRYADTSCSHCPAGKWYSSIYLDEYGWNDNALPCKMCQSFVKLKFRSTVQYYYEETCPCYRPNPETAVKRALKYIALYESKYGEIEI